jgi:hypothetical protein
MCLMLKINLFDLYVGHYVYEIVFIYYVVIKSINSEIKIKMSDSKFMTAKMYLCPMRFILYSRSISRYSPRRPHFPKSIQLCVIL